MATNSNEIQKSHEKPGGNTKPPDFQCYKWCFTWPESVLYEEHEVRFTPSQISRELKDIAKKFTFQLEAGKENGYRHYQGQLSLISKLNLAVIKNLLGPKIHWERTRDYFAAQNYSTKTSTRIAGPWSEKSTFVDVVTNLRPWQYDCMIKIMSAKSDRIIWWFWDPKGNTGKTQFCKFMAVQYGATVIGNGAFKDIASSLPDDPKMVLMNLTRDLETHINYSALEAIKDGLIFSAKYESKMKIFNSPVVCVFANFEPRTEAMSLDRWRIIRIDN